MKAQDIDQTAKWLPADEVAPAKNRQHSWPCYLNSSTM